MSIKIKAGQRLLSDLTNQEKVLHYQRMLNRVTTRLLKINPDKAPYTYNRHKARESRLMSRIDSLKSKHRY